MELKLDFEDSGFNNNVIKSDPNYVHLKTNVKNEDDAWRWKAILEKKNSLQCKENIKDAVVHLSPRIHLCAWRETPQRKKENIHWVLSVIPLLLI